jgi:hypothetical protein
MRLSRNQVGESGDGFLGIGTVGFDSQYRSALGGKAQQAQDASAVHHETFTINLDVRLERIRQSHEPAGDSQLNPQDVSNPDLATGVMDVLSH